MSCGLVIWSPTLLMDDDVVEWACKAAEAEYKLLCAVQESGLDENNLRRLRCRFDMRNDDRAYQMFEAAVSVMAALSVDKPKREWAKQADYSKPQFKAWGTHDSGP